ncbi:MAG: serine/threonine-protein kinase [Gemmatimonadota bacterium]|nr:serine/threonine-protein kinase [Gemmatimonadota bacterium]
MADILESQLRQTLAGTHTVERELPGGGLSRLFIGSELRFQRRVVIKVLPPDFVAGVSVERFEREIAFAANLQHANIVPVLTAGETGGLPFFTMPFVDGESLRARLKRGPIPPLETRSILIDVARALSCAHSHGIVHRDIKPENILLSGGAATVTDFGVAKALAVSKHLAPAETLTGVGLSLGTPAYMSPEQAVDDDVDARSDLYSWGIVAYEMITGRHPFAHRKNFQQLVIAHVSEKPAPLTNAPGYSAALRKAVMRCLAKAPGARPSSADSLLLEIRRRSPWRAGAGAIAAGIVLAIGLLAGVAFAFVPRDKLAMVMALSRRSPVPLHNDRIIVAPFSNETGEQHLTPLGSMAADWIAQGLARTGALHVVDARTVAITSEVVRRTPWPWRGRDKGKALARETGAGILISGRFYRDADTLRFQANVIDVSDGKLLWSLPPVSGPVASPTTVLENLTRRIVALVAQTSDTTSAVLSTLSSPPSLDAYTEFRKGLEGVFTRSDAAYGHLFRATSLDTTYVTPWVLLAVAAEDRGDKAVMDSALKRANKLTERMTPVERAIIEYTESKTQGDLDGTLRAAKTFFQLTPGSSESPLLLATAALADRRPHTALAALREVDPDRGLNLAAPFFWKNRTAALYQLGDYRGAADACSRGGKRFPKDYFLAYFCVSSLLHLGKADRVTDLVANEELGAARGELAAHAAQVLEEVGSAAESRRLATKWLDDLANGLELDHSRALLLMAAGRWVEAKAILARLAEADASPGPPSREGRIPGRLRALGTLGIVNARLLLPAEALRIDSLLKISGAVAEGGEIEILRARIHAQLGDSEAGVALAEAGRDKGWELLSLMNSLADDHWLAPLRPLPSFRSIIALKD